MVSLKIMYTEFIVPLRFLFMDLNERVFGKVMIREIIGETPIESEMQKKLEDELGILLKELDGKTKDFLENCLDRSTKSGKLVNSHPGAMALAQSKIRLFNEYNSRYINEINHFKNSLR